jgi:cell division protease FtsH
METKQQRFSIGYVLLVLLLLLTVQSLFFGPHQANVTYSEFKELVAKGKVSDLTLERDTITGTLVADGLEGVLPAERIAELKKYGEGGHRFVAVRVEDPQLVPELEAAKVAFTGRLENRWWSTLLSWVLPGLIFFGLWMVLMSRMGAAAQGGLMTIGKSKAKVHNGRAPRTATSFALTCTAYRPM